MKYKAINTYIGTQQEPYSKVNVHEITERGYALRYQGSLSYHDLSN